MQGKYDSVLLAKYIVAVANDKGIFMNITKVQKLLYAAYGVYLAVKGGRLTDEHPQAWPYGPVFPKTRRKLLKLDFADIKKTDSDFVDLVSDGELSSLFNLIFRTYGSWTAAQLTEWSHREGSPWEMATLAEDFKWGSEIPDEYIHDYFKRLIHVSD